MRRKYLLSQQLRLDHGHGLLVVGRREQVAVAFHGHLDRGVASEGHNLLDREALLDPERHTHEDAEVIAATVAGLPDSLGGKRMAIRVAELARAGLTPDWMPGAVPRVVPVDTRRNQHGERAATIVVGTERVLSRGKWRTVEVPACPVTLRPHPQQIEAAHRGYDDWWQALDWVRDGLVSARMLREVEVTGVMPRVRPWGEAV